MSTRVKLQRQLWNDVYLDSLFGNPQRRQLIYIREFKPGPLSGRSQLTIEDLLNKAEQCGGSDWVPQPRIKIHDRNGMFMRWNKSEGTITTDDVSKLPLSHIFLVCHDSMCYKFEYTNVMDCDTTHNMMTTDISIWNGLNSTARQQIPNCPYVFISGSIAEQVDIPPYISKVSHPAFLVDSKVIKYSDSDIMIVLPNHNVAFENYQGSNIVGVIETKACRPGYLRLLHVNSDAVQEITTQNLDGKYYITKDVLRGLNIFDTFVEIYDTVKKSNKLPVYFAHEKCDLKGPSINTTVAIPANSDSQVTFGEIKRFLLYKFDAVICLKCLSWPHVAEKWIHRSRSSGWPSVGTVHTIVSEGCHVVAASHPFSSNREIEFRFSFSLAEVALFHVMSLEQKHCYASFKAIVRKSVDIYMPEEEQCEAHLKSYHLKTIFLWTCETIPQNEWDTPSGWVGCFLFLVDQLAICLDNKFLPGYFIPQYNLLDTIPDEDLKTLSCIVNHIRQNPIESAMEFLTSMVLFQFRPSHFFEYLDSRLIPLPSDTVYVEKIAFQKELALLQNLIISYDKCENPKFWRKSSFLRLFSNWCNSKLDHVSSSSEFLCEQMSLFDVVYLDTEFNLDVPLDILSAFAIGEQRCDLKCKLACCYGTKFKAGEQCNQTLNQKACLLFDTTAGVENYSIIYGSYLCSIRYYPEAEAILRSFDGLETEANIFNTAILVYPFHKQALEIQEIKDLKTDENSIYLSSNVFMCYLLIKCYLQFGQCDEIIDTIISRLGTLCSNMDPTKKYFNCQLLAEVCLDLDTAPGEILREAIKGMLSGKLLILPQNINKSRDLFTAEKAAHLRCATTYFHALFATLKALVVPGMNPSNELYLHFEKLLHECEKMLLNSRPGTLSAPPCDETNNACPHVESSLPMTTIALFRLATIYFPEKADLFKNLANANFETTLGFCLKMTDKLNFSGSYLIKFIFLSLNEEWLNTGGVVPWKVNSFPLFRWLALTCKPTPANKTYYAQFLLNIKIAKLAIPVLEEVIEVESRSPVSLIIWPQELKLSVDDRIRSVLDNSDRSYLVLPTIIYACYLLSRVYFAFEQTLDLKRTMKRFQDSCEILGDVFPISYSLLEFSRQLAGDESKIERGVAGSGSIEWKQVTDGGNRGIIDPRSILDGIYNEQHNLGFEMWQSQLETMCKSFSSIMNWKESVEEFLLIFENGRSTNDCFICRSMD